MTDFYCIGIIGLTLWPHFYFKFELTQLTSVEFWLIHARLLISEHWRWCQNKTHSPLQVSGWGFLYLGQSVQFGQVRNLRFMLSQIICKLTWNYFPLKLMGLTSKDVYLGLRWQFNMRFIKNAFIWVLLGSKLMLTQDQFWIWKQYTVFRLQSCVELCVIGTTVSLNMLNTTWYILFHCSCFHQWVLAWIMYDLITSGWGELIFKFFNARSFHLNVETITREH